MIENENIKDSRHLAQIVALHAVPNLAAHGEVANGVRQTIPPPQTSFQHYNKLNQCSALKSKVDASFLLPHREFLTIHHSAINSQQTRCPPNADTHET